MRDDTRIVGQRMQALRESADLSQNMLAKALGIQQPSIYRYETGRTAVPMNVMLLYAEFFDVSLDYIYGCTENRHGMFFPRNRTWNAATRRWTSSSKCVLSRAPPQAQS